MQEGTMRLKIRTIGLLSMVAALALVACGSDSTPAAAPAPAAPAKAVATTPPANTPTPIVIVQEGKTVVVTATPAPTSAPAPTATKAPRKPTGTLNVVDNLGTEQYLPRLATQEAPLNYMGDPLVWWDWGIDGPTNKAVLESWKFTENADGSVDYSLVIKPNIKFHKGWGNVTSADIKFNFTENLKEGTVNGNRRHYANFYGADPKNLDDSNPLVLKVHQPAKFNIIEMFRVFSAEETRGIRPYPKAYMEKVGEKEFAANPVFAGPYEFTSSSRGYDVLLTAVDDHYRITPGFKQIHYFKVLDLATKVAMLRTGQIDIGIIPGRLAKEVASAGIDIVISKNAVEPFLNFGGLYWGNPAYDANFPWTTATPLEGSAVEVRKAMNYAIDREAILKNILFGFGEVGIIAFSFKSPTAGPNGGPPPWWNPAWKPHPYDPVLAKKILKDAGHEGCFKFNIWLLAGSTYAADIGEAVAGMLEKNLGCEITRRLGEYRPGLRSKLIDQKTDGWTYIFEGSPIARPQRYACLHGGPNYQVIMHSTLQFFTDICKKSDKVMDAVALAKYEREIGDWEYKTFNTAAIVSVHGLYGVGPKVKKGSYTPAPHKALMLLMDSALPA